MIALRLLGIGNVAAGAASCRSRLVQSGRLCRTFTFLSLFFFLIMPSVFLADTADAAWGTSTIDSTTAADVGQYASIAVGTSGAAYISYYDVTNANLVYATNVSGAWGTSTIDSTGTSGLYSSIAIDTSGAAYIGYFYWDSGNLKYATNVSGSWVTSDAHNIGNETGAYSSIAVGTSGASYMSHYNTNLGDLLYTTNVSGSWVTTTVDSSGNNNTSGHTSIEVGTSGAVYISYYNATNADLVYATNVSGSWVASTIDSTTAADVGQYASIAVGTSGAAYISYYDATNGNLMYATNVSGSWGTQTVDATNNAGQYCSLAVGTSGAAYISYYGSSTSGALMYATNVSGTWGTSTIDSTTAADIGRYTSIAVGTSGAVYISYYDVTNANLMYAVNPTHTAVTGAASGVTTSGATLSGTANATGLPTTAYFQYGLTSGSYTGTSSTQSVSGTSDTAVSIALSGLSAGTTYYYRLANQHFTNLVYGSEASFSTTPSSAPPPIKVTLTVNSTSPSNGATGVGTNTVVTATFSDNMNGSTLTTDTFKLSGGGSSVTGSVSTNGNKVTFTPASSLANNTTYTATITTGAQAANAAGTTMDSDYAWSFTTESAPIVSTPTVTPLPTTAATPTAVSTPTPTPVSSPTPSPTPAITPTQLADMSLSKAVAYLSGDTVAVTVVDADRDANVASEDTLTTALKVTALNYYAGGNLILDLKENAVNSGTFLATIKTGTTTIGGASASTRANIGTIKTVQGGTATVIYTDTAPNASTITKTLSFSSSDATVKFDAESYTVGSYAVVTHVDAEENEDATNVDILLNHAVIETSSINRAWMKLVETGADTGTFRGSILVSSTATLDNESIQASNGDTLTVGCTDEINTSGAPRQVTAVSRVVSSEPTPTPATTLTPIPSPTSSPTSSPVECTAGEMALSPVKLNLRKNESDEVTVTVTGTNGCPVEGKQVKAEVRTGRNLVSVSPANQETDEDGKAVFTIEAKKRTGIAKITFSAEALKKSMNVKVLETKKTDWITNPANGHYYKAVKGGTWLKCKKLAEKEGAHLVTINNQKEQQWLTKTFGVDKRYGIGLTDRDKEGVWKWVSGEKVTYTNWKAGEPNDRNGCEDYAVMNWDSSGEWNDIGPCNSVDWREAGEWGIIEKTQD